MSDESWDPNGSLICPYDPLHVISVKRYQYHIIKCRKVCILYSSGDLIKNLYSQLHQGVR